MLRPWEFFVVKLQERRDDQDGFDNRKAPLRLNLVTQLSAIPISIDTHPTGQFNCLAQESLPSLAAR